VLKKIEPPKSDVKNVLRERLESPDDIEAMIIIEYHRDGTQRLHTTSCSMEVKCFLKAFFDSWVGNWFNQSYEIEPKKP
jgi:hypothetical protein